MSVKAEGNFLHGSIDNGWERLNVAFTVNVHVRDSPELDATCILIRAVEALKEAVKQEYERMVGEEEASAKPTDHYVSPYRQSERQEEQS